MQTYKNFIKEERTNPHLNIKETIIESLRKYSSDNSVHIHFTNGVDDVPHLSLNYDYKHPAGTPMGIYAYPLSLVYKTENHFINFMYNGSYANDRKYVYVLRETYPLYRLSKFNESKLYNDYDKLKQMYGEYDSNLENSDPFDDLQELVDYYSNDDPKKKTLIYLKLGYNGFIDDSQYRLTPDIKYQSVFFNPRSYKIVDFFYNRM